MPCLIARLPPFDFNCPFAAPTAATLPAKLTPLAEKRRAKSAHPRVCSKSIQKIKAGGQPGDVVISFRHRDTQVLGVGPCDPDTPIPVKMLHHHGRRAIDAAFFRGRIEAAWERRSPLRTEHRITAYRLVYGENDGLPGLMAGLCDRVLLVKLYSLIYLIAQGRQYDLAVIDPPSFAKSSDEAWRHSGNARNSPRRSAH